VAGVMVSEHSSLGPQELELVLCGLPEIDIEDWKNNCDYKAGYKNTDQIIRWYWEILADWDQVRK